MRGFQQIKFSLSDLVSSYKLQELAPAVPKLWFESSIQNLSSSILNPKSKVSILKLMSKGVLHPGCNKNISPLEIQGLFCDEYWYSVLFTRSTYLFSNPSICSRARNVLNRHLFTATISVNFRIFWTFFEILLWTSH